MELLPVWHQLLSQLWAAAMPLINAVMWVIHVLYGKAS